MQELIKLSLTETLLKLMKKDFSVTELINAHIKQIQAHENLNCFITTNFEKALENAKISENLYLSGKQRKLEGIPISIKDIFCTKNIKTTAGSKMLSNFIAPYESTVTQKLENAGYIMMGKTNMDEFAMGSANLNSFFGPVVNPWKMYDNPANLTPGGSSGGSAASVSSFQSIASIGSDTGGSVRLPAAYNGLCGVKPTYGRCSRWGMIAFANSLDQAAVLTRNVSDAALILEIIMGYDEKDSTTSNNIVPNLRSSYLEAEENVKIGVPYDIIYDKEIDSEVLRIFNDTLDKLRIQTSEITNIKLPSIKYAIPTYYVIASAEAASNLSKYDSIRYGYNPEVEEKELQNLEELYFKTRTEGFGEEVKRRIMTGTYVLSKSYKDTYYNQAQRARFLIQKEFDAAFKTSDVIILPTTSNTPFANNKEISTPIEEYMNDFFTVPASLAGLPCISMPIGLTNLGLPVSIQVIGNHFEEKTMFKAAFKIENCINSQFTPRGF